MANSAQARKRARQAVKQRAHNASQRSALRTAIKKIIKAVDQVFDFRPRAIIDTLKLRRPIYLETARNGHFGRELPNFTWEKTDKAAALKKAVGL